MSDTEFKEMLQKIYLTLEFDTYNTETINFPPKVVRAMNICSKQIKKFLDEE